jgi:glycosyltransferase involved in cell wall biosynthesis
MHLIGLGVKKNLPDLPWIADFRDPWTNIDFYKELNLTWLADKIHRHLEKKVVRQADSMVTVSEGWMKEFEQMRPKRIQVISNGYDESDVKQIAVQLDEKFSISHIGTLNAARNPQTVWKVLSKICTDNQEFRADLQIQLVGKVDFSVLESIREYNLQENLNKIDYLSHSEAIAKQQSSQLLLLLINQSPNANGILTGKFYEYLASKRPILAIGPTDGDAARVLNDTGAGTMVGFSDEVDTEKTILDYYARYKSNTLVVQTESVEKFSRRSLTGELALLLNSL